MEKTAKLGLKEKAKRVLSAAQNGGKKVAKKLKENTVEFLHDNRGGYKIPKKGESDSKDSSLLNRRQALNKAKERAGIPRSQQPIRQWKVGDNINMKGRDTANYRYDPNPGSHGRYYEYDTPNGKRVIVEHTNDGIPHVHAGQPKGNPSAHTYDFKTNRYQKINGLDGDHHIYYE